MVGGRDRPGRSRPTDPLCMIKNGAHRAAIRVLAFRSLNISLLASCCLRPTADSFKRAFRAAGFRSVRFCDVDPESGQSTSGFRCIVRF